MSHNWLHTPDCKVLNEMTPGQSVAELLPPQQVLSLCKTIAVTSNKDLGEGFECTLFELSQAELSQVEMC